ncbi:MAG: hypothetical protein ACRDJC_14755, partial [Thermomicrobiales bacterium]
IAAKHHESLFVVCGFQNLQPPVSLPLKRLKFVYALTSRESRRASVPVLARTKRHNPRWVRHDATLVDDTLYVKRK